MATLDGVNSTSARADLRVKVDVTEDHGRMRVKKDEITLSAELTAADVIRMGPKLPAGAMIVEAWLQSPQLGSGGGNGELDVGWEAGPLGDEAADPDGLFDGVEVGSAAANVKVTDTNPGLVGYLKKFTESVQLTITAVETTDAAIGDKITLVVMYVVD